MISIREMIRQNPWFGWVLFFFTMLAVFVIGLLASSVMERRAEAEFAYAPETDIAEWEPRSEVWGISFPREYQRFMQTDDTSFRSKYCGSAMIDVLEEDPRWVVLWAGYSFSKDYVQARGHYYALDDIRESLRTGAPMQKGEGPMPNTCWTCKGPDVPRLMAETGPAAFYEGKWFDKGEEIINTIGCADCHEPETMNLRITRPALREAWERMGKDIDEVSYQELRTLVCAQCHVEYYFRGDGNYLVHPWDEGLGADDMNRYYDRDGFSEWEHGVSGAPMLKAQHPDYEIFTTGIHYKRGVACADCHMPYINEGGIKYTDHWVRSPLASISTTCQVCHQESEEDLRNDVYERQDRVMAVRNRLEKQLVRAHYEAARARELGNSRQDLDPALRLIREAQWRCDYIAASHGAAFHSSDESLFTLGEGIALAQEARVKLARLLTGSGYGKELPYPEIDTREEASALIRLDMEKLREEKEIFLERIVPRWIRQGREREERELPGYDLD